MNMETEETSLNSQKETHLSHEKKPLTFHYTGCSRGILDPYVMVYELIPT